MGNRRTSVHALQVRSVHNASRLEPVLTSTTETPHARGEYNDPHGHVQPASLTESFVREQVYRLHATVGNESVGTSCCSRYGVRGEERERVDYKKFQDDIYHHRPQKKSLVCVCKLLTTCPWMEREREGRKRSPDTRERYMRSGKWTDMYRQGGRKKGKKEKTKSKK